MKQHDHGALIQGLHRPVEHAMREHDMQLSSQLSPSDMPQQQNPTSPNPHKQAPTL